MSNVRVLVGTRKGAFVLTSDGKREKWDVSGPHFAGWEIYHMKGSPADPNRIYASQTSGWFGQIIQRSDDGGKTWHQPGTPPGEPTTTPQGLPKGESNKFVYDTSAETGKPLTTHQWYDGTQHPWEFKRVWHVEPHSRIPIRLTRESRTRRYFARPMAARTGKNFQDCAAMAPVRSGSPVPAACACTRSFSIRAIHGGYGSPFPLPAHSAPTMGAKPGSRSTRGCARNTFPILKLRSATAFIMSL